MHSDNLERPSSLVQLRLFTWKGLPAQSCPRPLGSKSHRTEWGLLPGVYGSGSQNCQGHGAPHSLFFPVHLGTTLLALTRSKVVAPKSHEILRDPEWQHPVEQVGGAT